MPFNNAINSPYPTAGSKGGTGIASPTAHAILIANGSSAMNQILLTNGQLLIGSTGNDPVAAAITAGTGISVNLSAGGITISAIGSGAFTWNNVTGTTQAMSVNNGYIANNAGLVTLTLPAVAAVGDTLSIAGYGAGGFSVAQNSTQTIHYGAFNTTTGAGGSLSSTNRYDQLTLLCTVANTDFVVINAMGNITYA